MHYPRERIGTYARVTAHRLMGDGHARFSHHLFALPRVFPSNPAVRSLGVSELISPSRIPVHASHRHPSHFRERLTTLAGALGRVASRGSVA